MTNTIPNVPRYRVEKTGRGFWPYCVRAGDGTREVFVGHQKQCAVVAAELETAFEDGKFVSYIAPSPAGVDGLEVVAWSVSFPSWQGTKVYEQRQEWAYRTYGDIAYTVEDLCRLSDAKAIIDGLRGEVAKINSDRLACWAEFKVMTRACLDAEKERDQQAETIANYKSQFSELHAARNLLSLLSAAGFELGDDAAVSVIAERDKQAQRIGELEGLLREVAASLAWIAHGECRAIHDGPIMPSQMALDAAKAALSAGKEDAQ